MARRKRGKGPSVSGYFKQVFAEHPEWLDQSSNDIILARYREDHSLAPDAELPKNLRQNLANVKSYLRHQDRDEKAGGKAKARARVVAAVAHRGAGGRLAALEEMIDDCLTLARTQDRAGLDSIIQHLRRARNEVVWKMGEK